MTVFEICGFDGSMNQDDNQNIPAVGVAIEADRKNTTMTITGFDLSIGTNEPIDDGEGDKQDDDQAN